MMPKMAYLTDKLFVSLVRLIVEQERRKKKEERRKKKEERFSSQ
jgi:hypothetical protein